MANGKSSKGYGKRSALRWVVIYVVVGAIVYGLIYLVFMRGGNSGYSY